VINLRAKFEVSSSNILCVPQAVHLAQAYLKHLVCRLCPSPKWPKNVSSETLNPNPTNLQTLYGVPAPLLARVAISLSRIDRCKLVVYNIVLLS